MTTPISRPLSALQQAWVIALDRVLLRLLQHWLLTLNLLWAGFISLPWLAPVLMETGHQTAARAIYALYSTQCHQLPQRSFFVFGAQSSYSLSEIQAAWRNTNNPAILRQFIGNREMGWKVAWSDRMVSMYTTILIAGLVLALVRKPLKPLPVWAFALLVIPVALDGSTHLISDVFGIGQGFRDSNAWLAALTGNALPIRFYAGDALGSFNSWMRLVTGILFGTGYVGMVYPYLEKFFSETRDELEVKLQRAGASA